MSAEKKLEARVVAYCKKRGLYTRKFISPANRGVPDRIIAGDRKVLFLELKAPGKKPTALQSLEIKQLRAKGMAAEYVDNYPAAVELINLLWPFPQTNFI